LQVPVSTEEGTPEVSGIERLSASAQPVCEIHHKLLTPTLEVV